MSTNMATLIAIGVYLIGFISIVVTIVLINKKNKKKLEIEVERLEVLKNLIINSGILTEMEKVKTLINSEKLEEKYDKWQKRFNKIINEDVPLLTDKLLEVEGLIENKNFKEASYYLAKCELEIYYTKTNMELLLEEIKELTLSAEKNRNAVTKLKSTYRKVVNKYNNNLDDYKGMTKNIELQFENIDKLLSAFERVMEENDYEEVSKIVHALDDLINNIKIVIDETPSVILMGKMIIPKKINDLKVLNNKMKKEGYNVEYMNLDNNIEEARKKLNDIFDKLKKLNLEDSLFELKTMLDYFEGLFNDFDREKASKKEYEKYIENIGSKIVRLNAVIKDIYKEVDKLKDTYELTPLELENLNKLSIELGEEKDSYKKINDRTLSKTIPYSRLARDCELISVNIAKTEDKLENVIKNLGSLKEDEVRAREQLTEIRSILKGAKNKLKTYELPVIPKKYYVELEEAKESIDSIVTELEKKPIVINDLNTRVDTSRDLVLKLYSLTSDLTKTAGMAEMAIVYGNRYRSSYKDVDLGLNKATSEFKKGEYKLSLETTLNTLNNVEPGIYDKLLKSYKN